MDLKKIPLFQTLSDKHIEKILAISETMEKAKGEAVFREGDAGDALYIVTEGAVSAIKEIDRDKGLEKVIATMGAGNFFGEMALLDDQPRSATIRAAGTASLLMIKRDEFTALLQEDVLVASRLLFGIIKEVSNRLRESNTELVTLYDTGKLMAAGKDIQSLCMQILERIVNTVNADAGVIVLKNEITGEKEITAQTGFSNNVNISVEKSVIDIIMKSGKNLHVNNYHEEPIVKEVALCGCENASMIGLPLKQQETVKGAIILNKADTFAFSSRKFIMVKAVAAQLATAVENSLLYQEKADREKLSRQYVSF